MVNQYEIPKYFYASEVSMLLGISQQIVRQNCANGQFLAIQKGGQNGIWHIESEQFFKHPNWNTFILQRNQRFENTKKIAELAIELINLQDESVE